MREEEEVAVEGRGKTRAPSSLEGRQEGLNNEKVSPRGIECVHEIYLAFILDTRLLMNMRKKNLCK